MGKSNRRSTEQGRTLVYDGWNRLVQVKNGSTVLKAYTYDGENRKVTEDDGTTETQLVYSAAWQVLEERVGSAYTNRYVWSPVYVDALVLRDDGTLRLWAVQDANWNVTALVGDSGNVLERFGYDDPYGKVTVYDVTWNVKSGGSGYAWAITFQGMRADDTTGNFCQRNRWYSPTLGRWITVDPLRFDAGSANLYGMVGNNPSNQLDSAGLLSEEEAKKALIEFKKTDYYQGFVKGLARNKLNEPGIDLKGENAPNYKKNISGTTTPDGKNISLFYVNIGSVESFNKVLSHELIHSWDGLNQYFKDVQPGSSYIVKELRAYAFCGEYAGEEDVAVAIFDQVRSQAEAMKKIREDFFGDVGIENILYTLWEAALDKTTLWEGFTPYNSKMKLPLAPPTGKDGNVEFSGYKESAGKLSEEAKKLYPPAK